MGIDILDTIIANKRLEVKRQKQAVPLQTLISLGNDRIDRPVNSMRQSLENSDSGIISEFKRKSPSKGWLHPGARVQDVIPCYEKYGASACSILTDGDFFGGAFGDLYQARKLVNIPLLRKDFIIDPYQIYQARVMGADAILLIAANLTPDECLELAKTAHSLSLEVLLEIHTEEELEYLNPYIDMLGVNNRNLGTFHTDVQNSFRLIEQMKQKAAKTGYNPLMISESGISDPATVAQLREAGYRGFLIGETFMKTEDPGKALQNFILQMKNEMSE
ncbi:MAG: indole-3-glycerol phosphate synthase TrpC [Tannerellaceae bacterium]|nr:indole-3-glycerol phosphate synthase TrpC [Tannerellaceae bacterium]